MSIEATRNCIKSIQDEINRDLDKKTIIVSRVAINNIIFHAEKSIKNQQTEKEVRLKHKNDIKKLKDALRSAQAKAAYYEEKLREARRAIE